MNHTAGKLTFSWDTWKDGAYRLDRDVFGGSNLFTGHKGSLFCLQHEYGDCMYVRTIGPVEGLPDYVIPTGHYRTVVYPNEFDKYGYAPKTSMLRFSFNRTSTDAAWTYVGVEFDPDIHKMQTPPAVASVMINTHNGTIEMGAVCPTTMCTQGLECRCTGVAPAQSFFDGRSTNRANFYYFA